MKTLNRRAARASGVSLIEAVIAIGVLAVAIPLAFAAIVKAGEVGGNARAETRAPLIAEFVRTELELARRGESEVFERVEPDQPMAVKALGFAPDGNYLGTLEGADYSGGRRKLDDKEIGFIVAVSGEPEDRGLLVTVKVEHPAVRSSTDRSAVAFHTLLP